MVLPEISLLETVIVLDLDDTLYSEADYQVSGFKEVARWIERIYGKNVENDLDRLLEQGVQDILSGLCNVAGVPETIKQSLLWIYRLHEPDISLSADVKKTVAELESKSAGVSILTDGRSISQRMKLKALGLSHLRVYISEEYGGEKPSPLRFEAVMQDMPARHYIYVADNPAKDFIAPNRIGWVTIGMKGSSRNVHMQAVDDWSEEHLPSLWITALSQLMEQ